MSARSAYVIVASTSAAAGTAEDTTGPKIANWLTERGFTVSSPVVVADGQPVRHAAQTALRAGADFVITTGGTGVSPDDQTPEMIQPLLELELPGIIEAVRRRGEAATPMAVITRGVAGFAGHTLLVTLPGSSGGVKDGLAVLDPIWEHLLNQRSGQQGHGKRN